MKKFIGRNIRLIEWCLGIFAVIIPIAAWLSDTNVTRLTLYDLFPPLGLIAFGLMWTHFIMNALRTYTGVESDTNNMYASISMGLVLALIILHPVLFWTALYLDGYGLPPASYSKTYGGELGMLALGTIALCIFLAYEFKRIFGDKKWWKYVSGVQIVGMAAIFIHALNLGQDIKVGFMMTTWIVYGVTLAVAYGYGLYTDKKARTA